MLYTIFNIFFYYYLDAGISLENTSLFNSPNSSIHDNLADFLQTAETDDFIMENNDDLLNININSNTSENGALLNLSEIPHGSK